MGNSNFPARVRQRDSTMESLLSSFEANNSDDALKVIDLIKRGTIPFDREATFEGSLRSTRDCAYCRHMWKRANNFIFVRGIYELLGLGIDRHLQTTHNKDWRVNVGGIKPVWLALLFSVYDQVGASLGLDVFRTDWGTVFAELVPLSGPRLDDKVFGHPAYHLVFSEGIVPPRPVADPSDPDYDPNQARLAAILNVPYPYDDTFACHLRGRKLTPFREAYRTVVANSRDMDLTGITFPDGDVLSHLILWGYYEMFSLLLTGDTNPFARTLINTRGYLHMVEETDEIPADRRVSFVKLLEGAGQVVDLERDGKHCVQIALQWGHVETIMYYLTRHKIVRRLPVDLLHRVLDLEINFAPKDGYPSRVPEMIRLVVGEAVESRHDIFTPCRRGQTPLHRVCASGDLETARLIVNSATKLRVDVLGARDESGNLPIHLAGAGAGTGAGARARALTQFLMENKSPLNELNHLGQTPLHLVAKSGDLETAVALVGGGADVTRRDKWGRTPIDVALAERQFDFIHRLSGRAPRATPVL